MSRTLIAFIVVIVLGLGVLVLLSSRSQPQSGPDTSLLDTPTPVLQLFNPNGSGEKTASAAPTIVPISATKAVITTAKGEIDIDLFPDEAPKTVTNFATLAKYKFYDGLTFHRVEPGFVIQGGDPRGDGSGGTSIYGGPFPDEIKPDSDLYKAGYLEGTVAMANSGPNTNGSQFFIMWQDHPELPANYTIFGKVTKGMDVVHKMFPGDKIISITVE